MKLQIMHLCSQIQAWWKGNMVRHGIGPYAELMKAKKKGKGKKGNKSAKGKKKGKK